MHLALTDNQIKLTPLPGLYASRAEDPRIGDAVLGGLQVCTRQAKRADGDVQRAVQGPTGHIRKGKNSALREGRRHEGRFVYMSSAGGVLYATGNAASV